MKEKVLFLLHLERQMQLGVEVGGQLVLTFADDVAHGVEARHVTEQKEDLRAVSAVGELHGAKSALHELGGGSGFGPRLQRVQRVGEVVARPQALRVEQRQFGSGPQRRPATGDLLGLGRHPLEQAGAPLLGVQHAPHHGARRSVRADGEAGLRAVSLEDVAAFSVELGRSPFLVAFGPADAQVQQAQDAPVGRLKVVVVKLLREAQASKQLLDHVVVAIGNGGGGWDEAFLVLRLQEAVAGPFRDNLHDLFVSSSCRYVQNGLLRAADAPFGWKVCSNQNASAGHMTSADS